MNEEITKFNTDLTEESQQLNQSSKVPKLPAMSGVVSPFNLQVEKSFQSTATPGTTGRSAKIGAIRDRYNKTTNT